MLSEAEKEQNAVEMLQNKKFAFITGTPRAGTSAMVNLLNSHGKVLVGQERFNYTISRDELTPDHFLRQNFFKVKEGETHPGGGVHLRNVGPQKRIEKYNNAAILGDKYPRLYLHYDSILTNFPESRIIYITRNPLSVAESYHARWSNPEDGWYKSERTFRKGVEEWNESLHLTVAAVKKFGLERFKVVEQERLFQDQDAIDDLFRWLDLKPVRNESVAKIIEDADALDGKSVERENKIMSYVMKNADWQCYQAFRELTGF